MIVMDPQVFDDWNMLKKALEQKIREHIIQEGEIYFAHIGQNIGYESSGAAPVFERPVVVLKSFGNTFIGISLTTQPHRGPYYFAFNFFGITSIANLSQIRNLDIKRLGKRLGAMSNEDFRILKQLIKDILGL